MAVSDMSSSGQIAVFLLTSCLLLASHSHAQQRLDSIAPNEVVGVVSGAPNLVLNRAARNNFDECVSRIGISATKDLQTVSQEIEECRAQARQQSAPISEEALSNFRQQSRQQESMQ
jgi:hypothetical protein